MPGIQNPVIFLDSLTTSNTQVFENVYIPPVPKPKTKPVPLPATKDSTACQSCLLLWPNDQMLTLKSNKPTDSIMVCVGCYNRLAMCTQCKTIASLDVFRLGVSVAAYCPSCVPTNPPLQVEQLNTFIPQSKILEIRREKFWPKPKEEISVVNKKETPRKYEV